VKRNFLVVSASGQVREALAGSLRDHGYTVTLAANGREAERVVSSVSVDAALIESGLTDVSAERLQTAIRKARPGCRALILTSFEQVRNTPELLRFGRHDYLIRGDRLSDLVLAPFLAQPALQAGAQGDRGYEALIGVIDVLVGLLQIDERFFGGSSHRVTQWARAVAEAMAADADTVRETVVAALLRDVGKAGVEPELLEGREPFSAEQMERMREHVQVGLRLFEHIDFPWKVLPIIRHHHERYDGKGYPDGLQGREIPIGSRIVAVVDSYVAMTAPRNHRAARTPEEALAELIRGAGHHFDPEVVEVFQEVLSKRLDRRRGEGKPRVLIVEPHEGFRKLLKLHLLNMECEVEETSDKERALEAILRQPPQLVLADADADSAETFELLRELREDEALRQVPIALLSRSSNRVLKLRALREGVDDFLAKDDMEGLRARVENILVREALRRESGLRPGPRGITGNLDDLGLADIVQTLVIGMKTACVTIESEGRKGKIWFENGTPRHARVRGHDGEAAFFEMVSWRSGAFVIQHGVRCKKQTLVADAMYLLMEGMRLMDEAGGTESAAS
jgi:response regulator RpfG family c-di-GMP phosphodiesterase